MSDRASSLLTGEKWAIKFTGLDFSFALLYDLSYMFQSHWIIFKKKPLLKKQFVL
jgi:hypothetical protein